MAAENSEEDKIDISTEGMLRMAFGDPPIYETIDEVVITSKRTPKLASGDAMKDILKPIPEFDLNKFKTPNADVYKLLGIESNVSQLSLGKGQPTKKSGISNRRSLTLKGQIEAMMNDTETLQALKNASAKTGVSLSDLMTMAIIESGGNKNIGTNKYGYTGLMQLGEDAVADVRKNDPTITFDQVKNDVKTNALAGAIYWQRNASSLRQKNIESNVLNQYLAHQQGAGGLNQLIKTLRNNPEAPLIRNQKSNVPPKALRDHQGTFTQADFYNYWKGRISEIQLAVNQYLKK